MRNVKIRPSNVERFLNCNLSLWLPERQKTSEQEAYLAKRSKDHERLADGNFETHELQCRAYYDFLHDSCDDAIFVEKKCKALIDKDWFEGTPDLFAYNRESRTMYVVDYKTGFHYVSAQNNAQLLSYANLIMLNHKEWKIDNFVLSILNTQKDLCSHWYPEMETVLRHLARMKQVFQFRREKTAFAIAGDHCKFCPSKDYCPLQKDVTDIKNMFDEEIDNLIDAYDCRKTEIRKRRKEKKG